MVGQFVEVASNVLTGTAASSRRTVLDKGQYGNSSLVNLRSTACPLTNYEIPL